MLGAPVAPVGCAGSGTGLLSARDSLKGKEAAQHMQPLVKQAARCPPERMTEEKGAFGLGLFDFMKG